MSRSFISAFCPVGVLFIWAPVMMAEEPAPPTVKSRLFVFDEALGRLKEGLVPGGVFISADGRRVAQVIAKDGKWSVLVNSKRVGGEYDEIGKASIHFSADGQRLAFVGVRNDKKLFVIDGEDGPAHEGVAHSASIFSPDSKRTAYVAMREDGAKMAVFVDGTEIAEYDGVGKDGLIFSPDSKRLGFTAKKGVRFVAVVDGKEGRPYHGAAALVFSPDSAHFAYIGMLAGKMFLVVDGHEVSKFDGLPRDSLLKFTSPTRLHVVTLQETAIVRCEVLIGGVLGDAPPSKGGQAEPK